MRQIGCINLRLLHYETLTDICTVRNYSVANSVWGSEKRAVACRIGRRQLGRAKESEQVLRIDEIQFCFELLKPAHLVSKRFDFFAYPCQYIMVVRPNCCVALQFARSESRSSGWFDRAA